MSDEDVGRLALLAPEHRVAWLLLWLFNGDVIDDLAYEEALQAISCDEPTADAPPPRAS